MNDYNFYYITTTLQITFSGRFQYLSVSSEGQNTTSKLTPKYDKCILIPAYAGLTLSGLSLMENCQMQIDFTSCYQVYIILDIYITHHT